MVRPFDSWNTVKSVCHCRGLNDTPIFVLHRDDADTLLRTQIDRGDCRFVSEHVSNPIADLEWQLRGIQRTERTRSDF